ncbi:hypothetical protein G4V62_14920 [Bacillaceae bacterium SIJ1]|uniref:hypothetical protein n=1 Tax=Litoribacterium kuwaitense TaxID=1398745 RepID=UPI0013EB31A0|nr:hypothetical protein [Litoribacterium kuwaitense]NGP46178.1 hypothetical protein [Litoribacterium kuwaitense]
MRHIIPYLLFASVIGITMTGSLILHTYSIYIFYTVYDEMKTMITWALLGSYTLFVVSFLQARLSTSTEQVCFDEKRGALTKKLQALNKSADRIPGIIWVGFSLLLLYIMITGYFEYEVFVTIFYVVAMVVTFFLAVKYEKNTFTKEEVEENLQNEHKPFRWIDYRKQPFSISFILLTCIIFYYFWINPEGAIHDHETVDTSSRHAMSLPFTALLLTHSTFYNVLLYISHHFSFLGFKKIYVSGDKVLTAHFFELIIGGLVLLQWIVSIIQFVWFNN